MAIATMGLILVNVIFWVFLQGAGGEPAMSYSVCEYGLIPGELSGAVPPGTQVQLGGDAACVLGPSSWLTVLSSMFMHGSCSTSSATCGSSGSRQQRRRHHGSSRYVVFYLLCGLAAALTQVYVNTHSALPMVGASGAIGGVMGAYAVTYPRARVETLIIFGFYVRVVSVPAVWMLAYWFVLQLLGGLPALAGDDGGGVAFWAHVGGFLAGVVLLFIFRNGQLLAAHRALRQAHEGSEQLVS
jgi:membrane associated rhomboid family serine protease